MRRLLTDEYGIRPVVIIAAVVAFVVALLLLLFLLLPDSACAQLTYNPSNPNYYSPANPGNPMNYAPGGLYGPPENGGC